jgi:formate hydrogenlyase subunit 6/NADH:ubiquinone oxidoreductase subunit I
MIYKVITKKEFKKFINGLIRENPTFGPKEVDRRGDGTAVYQFKKVNSFDEMDLDYTVTYSSVKNFFLPFREELSRFDFSDNDWEQVVEYKVNPRVIVGVRPCDINALNILDKILIGGTFPSPYYLARRKNTFLVGMDHEPLKDCFCESLRHETVHRGFNLFCTDIGDRYYLTIMSSKAFKFLQNVNVSDPTKDDDAKYHARRKYIRESFQAKVEVAELPSVLDIEFESAVWKKWGDKCLNCGSCAMVCPTCYCYGTEETIDVGLKESRKERVQHSCNLVDFAEVAGGHNFRPLKEDRLKYRFYHHYRGFAQNAEDPICVGCNRCGRACLAGINPKEVIDELQMET